MKVYTDGKDIENCMKSAIKSCFEDCVLDNYKVDKKDVEAILAYLEPNFDVAVEKFDEGNQFLRLSIEWIKSEHEVMKILFREPLNQPMKLMEIGSSVEDVQKIIGGYVHLIYLEKNVWCLIDEDGIAKGLENNFYHDQFGPILGNVVFCGADFTSLNVAQLEYVKEYIGFPIK